MALEYLPIFYSNMEMLKLLSYTQAGKVLMALMEYATEGKTDISLSDAGQMLYSKMRQEHDRSRQNYDEKCKNYSKAALRREEEKRNRAQSCTTVQNFDEDKDKNKDKDKDKDEYEYKYKSKDNAARSAYRRADAQERRGGKRLLKNNSVCTYKPEDLFIPIWELEGEDSTESAGGEPA